MSYTTAELITAYAKQGIEISEATAGLYNSQRETYNGHWEDVVYNGTTWDPTIGRPYADQYQCETCGGGMGRWAVEAPVDGKPDRILLCDTCAANPEFADETYVQLLTPEQHAALAEWAAAGIGAN